MGGGDLVAWPTLEQAPLMHWMAEQRRENVRWQRNQDMVEEYGWSNFIARHEASLLQKTVASFAIPPVSERSGHCCQWFLGRSV